ncbi:MAG TPA: arylamine N-acetyltransferase [Pseudonocardia sp.]|jgi:N-hydroxyarylamine O-acetyltransferase|uniref:arylamine N-acetyltransferase family protein n=1 Tax=Pseudonocardia sp. TaxID=60912 RepID=UPI002B4B28B6|nr:arylamine N-acetyltransferase [Pseudonocardia sp.]HLU57673.1 arylamine N-acetyltransferase [Pseudonocardia sp.]
MDVAAYLARIGAARPEAPTSAALVTLHRAHVRSVPFEDYDIHTGVAISLELDALEDKIVRRRRGGYCYELNGLFGALLRELGFAVTIVGAFSLDEDGARGPDTDHMRLLVDAVDGSWIVDVGNGARWPEPVPRRPGGHGRVQVYRDGDVWWTSERRGDGRWERGWAWTARPREMADFADRNAFQQHDPASDFLGRRVAALATPTGRISLVNGVFAELDGGVRTEREVSADEEWALLADRFGIVLDRPWAERVPQLAC